MKMEFFSEMNTLVKIKRVFKDANLNARDIEVVLCDLFNISRAEYQFHDDRFYGSEYNLRLCQILEMLQKNTPVEYITGKANFWKYEFKVSPDVLIPRPETELIIEKALEYYEKEEVIDILDLGTGSGILAISLTAEFKNSRVNAIDVSKDALEIAKENANKILSADNNIKFAQSNWYESLVAGKFDLIVTNPPYITLDEYHELDAKVKNFEPRLALTDEKDGLKHYQSIASGAKDYLKPDGLIMAEHGAGQDELLNKIFIENGFQIVENVVDLSQKNRILIARL